MLKLAPNLKFSVSITVLDTGIYIITVKLIYIIFFNVSRLKKDPYSW